MSLVSNRGDFFAVDRRTWASVYEKTGMHGAIAFLVLARGSIRDMRTTSWSAEAINQRTSLDWRKAKEAIKRLIDNTIIRQDKGGAKPRYFILPADPEGQPDWIWLPNDLVDGVDGNPAPIERVRQSGRPSALRLLIDLYGEQGFADIGGVHWRKLRQIYSREKLGQQGRYVVWGFKSSVKEVWTDKPLAKPHMTGKKVPYSDGKERDAGLQVFWNSLDTLNELGLVSFVPHVIEHDHSEGESAAVLHPFGWPVGEPAELELAEAAYQAGWAMLPEWRKAEMRRTGQDKELLLVPVLSHIPDVQMVGLARLTFRTKSAATAAWLTRATEWQEITAEFKRLVGLALTAKAEAC